MYILNTGGKELFKRRSAKTLMSADERKVSFALDNTEIESEADVDN